MDYRKKRPFRCQKNKKLAWYSRTQSKKFLTNDDEVWIPSLSSILLCSCTKLVVGCISQQDESLSLLYYWICEHQTNLIGDEPKSTSYYLAQLTHKRSQLRLNQQLRKVWEENMTLKFKRAQKKYCYAPSFVAGLWNNHDGRNIFSKIISFESKFSQN